MRFGRSVTFTRQSTSPETSAMVASVIIGIIGLVGAGFAWRFHSQYKTFLAARESVFVTEAGLSPSAHHAGSVVHLATGAVGTRRPASDAGFGLTATGAFALEREAQFCQWIETYTERTEKLEGGTERVHRTYFYHKTWTVSPIISLGYDQPGAHHNPLRNPFPSGAVDAVDVTLAEGFTLPAPLASTVRVEETPVLHFKPDSLTGFLTSPARMVHNFYYTASDGWFYSPYSPSAGEQIARAAMMWAEGTLTDFQIGDLFGTCTAGDVRVRFRAKVPEGGVSVVAAQVDASGLLGKFRVPGTSTDMALVHEGLHDADSMFLMEAADARFRFRVAIVLTALDIVILFFVVPIALKKTNKKAE